MSFSPSLLLFASAASFFSESSARVVGLSDSAAAFCSASFVSGSFALDVGFAAAVSFGRGFLASSVLNPGGGPDGGPPLLGSVVTVRIGIRRAIAEFWSCRLRALRLSWIELARRADLDIARPVEVDHVRSLRAPRVEEVFLGGGNGGNYMELTTTCKRVDNDGSPSHTSGCGHNGGAECKTTRVKVMVICNTDSGAA